MLIGRVSVITGDTASVGIHVLHLAREDSGEEKRLGKVNVLGGLEDVGGRCLAVLGEGKESVTGVDVHLHKVLTEAITFPRKAIHKWVGALKREAAAIPCAATLYLWYGEVIEMVTR